jgi:hypothetical protein
MSHKSPPSLHDIIPVINVLFVAKRGYSMVALAQSRLSNAPAGCTAGFSMSIVSFPDLKIGVGLSDYMPTADRWWVTFAMIPEVGPIEGW